MEKIDFPNISNLKIISLKDLLKIKPQGNLNLSKVEEINKIIHSVPGTFVDFNVLIDTRDTESQLGVFDVWQIAKDLATTVLSGSSKEFMAKIAVICPSKEFDRAKFFELCSLNRGLNVKAFTSFEDVFGWLSTSKIPD
jgi:hypothetical protein